MKKHYFIHFCCLLLKPSRALSVSLNKKRNGKFREILLVLDLRVRGGAPFSIIPKS